MQHMAKAVRMVRRKQEDALKEAEQEGAADQELEYAGAEFEG